MKYRYKMVRSYTDGCKTAGNELDRAFYNGYEFVRASELVTNTNGKCDYIEYILRQQIPELEVEK